MPRKLTEKQIERLKRNLDKIYGLRNQLLNLAQEPGNIRPLGEKAGELLRLLDNIAMQANPRNSELDSFIRETSARFVGMDLTLQPWPAVEHEIQLLCDYVNSLAFRFTEQGVKIIIGKTK